MVAVERVLDYSKTLPEAPLTRPGKLGRWVYTSCKIEYVVYVLKWKDSDSGPHFAHAFSVEKRRILGS